VVDHLLTLDLGLGREDGLVHQLVGQVHDGVTGRTQLAAASGRAGGESVELERNF
jgi:hypothetical protein